jgi:hypothetical protein
MLRRIFLVALLPTLHSVIPRPALAQTFQPWTCDGIRTSSYSNALQEAQAGDPVAMALLSQLYFCDDHLPKSQRLSKSFDWASKAAAKGNVSAMLVVAQFYLGGDAVVVPKKDTQTAGEWYFSAANLGAGKRATDPLFWLYRNRLYLPPKQIAECLDAYERGTQALSAHNYNESHAEMNRSYQLGCKWAGDNTAALSQATPRRDAAPSTPGRDAVTASAPHSPEEKNLNSSTVTGCLVGAQNHRYLVSDDRHPKGASVRFAADHDDMEARANALIGHEVTVTGIWKSYIGSSGAPFFQAVRIEDISADCAAHGSPNHNPG